MAIHPPKRWAILIGINFYSKGNSRQVDYQNLKGCVRDIAAVEDYLLNFMSMEKSCIAKLTATTPDDSELNDPEEPYDDKPTYQNMKRAGAPPSSRLARRRRGVLRSCHTLIRVNTV